MTVSLSSDSPYRCYRTSTPLTIDGRLDEPAWQTAPRSPRFVDVVSGTPGLYDTRAAALWDDEHLAWATVRRLPASSRPGTILKEILPWLFALFAWPLS